MPKLEEKRERDREYQAGISRQGRDISRWIHEAANPERRERARLDFRHFCESYFPETFFLAWSADHLKVIRRIEDAVLRGGLFGVAMPRGSGKTALCVRACIWAALYGHRDCVGLIASSEAAAVEQLEAIKTELECNDLLNEDFSEATGPIRSLEGIANRCKGQMYGEDRTHITWTQKVIILPMVPGSQASGAIIKVAGITGRIRGLSHTRPDGRTVRPSLVVIDDPQTDESARSLSQCAERERVLVGAVLGLAGPGKKISGIMPCTVIRQGDMADSILDNSKHPEWQGERTQMVYSFPTDTRLWEQYDDLRRVAMREKRQPIEATEFYRKHREQMDAGAVVAWAERFNPDELSALQHAMNLRFQNEAAFFAEYQNSPLPEAVSELEELTADQIAAKVNRLKRHAVPTSCSRITCGIDIQEKLLYYVVIAWEDDFGGAVVDYGSYPEQSRNYFTLRDAKRTLRMAAPGAGLEGSIHSGLERLTDELLAKDWRREDGMLLRITRCLIDANWGQSTGTVYQFCKRSKYTAALTPSHGKYFGAAALPLNESKAKPGERVGLNWRHGPSPQRGMRRVFFDSNYWKSHVHGRLTVTLADRGCLSLFGEKPGAHRMFAEHLTSEFRVRTEGRGRTVDEWRDRPEKSDNHLFDCCVMAAVAASIEGVALKEAGGPMPAKRERVSFAEQQRQARARRISG